ncbi:Protein SRI-1 [Aphelenchoides avenae]|nr:Protein SRI-1 [Aphelenchus avenae]
MHVNSALSFCATAIAFYFIIYRSPKSFGNYKWYLLNIAACSFAFDIYMTFFYVPQPLFPAMVICTKGILQPLGYLYGGVVGFYLFITFFGACSMSVVWAFAYRLAVLYNSEKRITSKRFITFMVLSQALYEAPTLVIYTMAILDRKAVEDALLAKYPLIEPYLIGQSCCAAAFDASPFSMAFMVVCAIQFALCLPIPSVILYMCHKVLKNSESQLTEKTKRMHRELLFSLIFQLLVPFSTLIVPFLICSIFILFEVNHVQPIFKTLFLSGTTHSFFNTVMMLALVAPYRHCIMRRVGISRGGQSVTTIRDRTPTVRPGTSKVKPIVVEGTTACS